MNVHWEGVEKIIGGHDISNPYVHIPIQIYNDLCAWVESNLGEQAIVEVGKNIGETFILRLLRME